ncbi:hypothetical protein COR50_08170 [Chitinophaga caeni]|uniref:Uncharacterized protein n=1 Tax=Chitinophaga caeni TaxID=2029983 RepID=A0A291QT64_9BACT|nr:hypothetical protein [Chitinophaga caeni]ATL47160.1 hypothetical protein COR50_08170 [Chitinophaga caeni]
MARAFELNSNEWELVTDASIIYRKNSIVEKAIGLMGEIQRAMEGQAITKDFPFPGKCLQYGAKISRGERYLALPYVILDYPRLFKGEAIFAFRTMFWWGQYFSITLLLAGEIKDRFTPGLLNMQQFLADEGFYICIHESPWHHHFESSNYRKISEVPAEAWGELIMASRFIKLAQPYGLGDWGKMLDFTVHAYAALLTRLDDSQRIIESVPDPVE